MTAYSKSQQLGKPVSSRKNGKKEVSPDEFWARARARLKVVYESHRITTCEYIDKRGARCGSKEVLGFAHIDNRKNLTRDEIQSYFCTLLLCQKHHRLIENDKEETARLFQALR